MLVLHISGYCDKIKFKINNVMKIKPLKFEWYGGQSEKNKLIRYTVLAYWNSINKNILFLTFKYLSIKIDIFWETIRFDNKNISSINSFSDFKMIKKFQRFYKHIYMAKITVFFKKFMNI